MPQHQITASDVNRIESALRAPRISTGTKAALRRMHPDMPPPLAFHRFAAENLPEMWEIKAAEWQCLILCMALLLAHGTRPDRSFGKALALGGYSEQRIERLLASEGDAQRIMLVRAVRYLEHKNYPFNWSDFVELLCSCDQNDEVYARIRRRIAQDYYKYLGQEGEN